jgi:hypothetical protein
MFHGRPPQREDYPGRPDVLVAYTALPGLLERFESAEALRSADFSKCGETFCYLKIDGIEGLEGSAFLDRQLLFPHSADSNLENLAHQGARRGVRP